MLYWMIGGLQVIGFEQINFILIFLFAGFFIILKNLNEMDLLLAGEDLAQSRGVDVYKGRVFGRLVSIGRLESISQLCR